MTTSPPPLLWPVPGFTTISSGWNDPRGDHPHNAIDIPAPEGTPFIAVADGRQYFAGPAGTCGIASYLQLKDGTKVQYCHAQRLTDARPRDVRAGDTLGYVGSSGESTGPHLHIAVMLDHPTPNSRPATAPDFAGMYVVNPAEYLGKEAPNVPDDQLRADMEKHEAFERHMADLRRAVDAVETAGSIASAQTKMLDVHKQAADLDTELAAGRVLP